MVTASRFPPGRRGLDLMEASAMEHTTVEQGEYTAPVVVDAGEVAEVTLGTASFDTADDTQYKN
jgi:hypothetical protein